MSRRLVIITEIISPYRIPLFNALAQHPEIDLHVIFLAETDPGLREWKVYKEEIKFSYEVLASWRKQIGGRSWLLNRGIGRALDRACPEVVLCGGYNYLASWRALMWAGAHEKRFFLWSESNLRDLRSGNALVEMCKAEFLRRCDGFVVPGRAAFEYLLSQRIREDRIFTAVNAVDNDFFAAASACARRDANSLRNELELPERFFLFVGRLVKEKGVFELLSAYAKLDAALRKQIGLVIVGDGPCRGVLEQEATSVSPGTVRFVGFAQREQLPRYYALGEVLILPTYTDTWGLVVNEAMTCGLPVILSRVAGCGDDLVTDGWNGYLVPARDVAALTSAMRTFANQPELRGAMGSNSRSRISNYSPQAWCEGILRVVEAAGDKHA